MHKLTKPFICPECNQSFTGKDARGYHSARFPLILNCGHSVCMSCIRLSAKQHKCITCEKCMKTTSLPDGEASVDNLVPDLHVVGTLTNFNRSIPRNFKVKFIPAGAPSLKDLPSNSTLVRCENCNGNAKWRCDKCNANLCNKCFDKIHSGSKLFKKHAGTRLVEHAYRSTVQAGCQEHEQKAIEFYCEDDGMLACSHCAVTGAHKGHQLVTLLEKNQGCVEDISKAMEEAKKMKRRLIHTEKKLSAILPTAKPNTQSHEQEIRDFFHELHCCLQLREAELLNELSATVTQCVSPVENMHQQVSESIKELMSLMNDADIVIASSGVPINAMELVTKLQQSLEFPCHLISSEESMTADFRLQLDSSVKDTIQNIGRLDAVVKQRYQLVSERDLPPNHEVDVIDNESTTTDSSSMNGSVMDDKQEPLSSNVPKVSELKAPKVAVKAKHTKLFQQELVHVAHIKNPCDFWVQRDMDIPKLKQLTGTINKWCNANKESLTPSQLVLGELYLVPYGSDENWYRARLKVIVGDISGHSDVTTVLGETTTFVTNSLNTPSENPVDTSGCNETNGASSSEVSVKLGVDPVSSSSKVESDQVEDSVSSSSKVPSEQVENLLSSSSKVPSDQVEDPLSTSKVSDETDGASSSDLSGSETTVLCKEVVTESVTSSQTEGDFSDARNEANLSSESSKSWAEAVEEQENQEMQLNTSFSNFLVIVQYVDYGNTETVPITRLRMMQSQFLKLACLALKCSLWELEPNGEENWSEEAVKMFAKFVGNNDPLMRVVDERNNILYIDLCRPPIADIANDIPISVREAMVFMEMAQFPNPQSSTLPISILSTHPRYKRKQEFFPAESLPTGQKFNVVVTHVNSPSDFYIQQPETHYLGNLTFEIRDYYNDEQLSQTLAIFLPTIGMACMAKFSLDNQWYRAQVTALPGGSMVQVLYVDFGNTEVVPICKLAKIIDRFMKLPVQALHCTLADVVPVERSGWTEEGIAWFKEATKKGISMIVHDKPLKEKAVVSLFESTELAIRCISGLLVVEGHARSTGSRSAYTEEQQNVPMDTKSEELDKAPKPPGVKVKKKHNYTAVTVSHFEDPGCIYIQTAGKEEKRSINRLMKDLKEACEKMGPSQQKWSEGDVCAALHSKDKRWYRSRITSIDKNVAKVLLMDYGNSDSVPLDHLRKLGEDFEKDDIFAIRCHLTGMTPAGDTRKWSRMACECLKETLTRNEVIYLKLKGVCENDSQAVDLFIKEVRQGSAVDPSTVVYASVTEMLVDQGLAIPTKRASKSSKAITEDESMLNASFDLDNGVSSNSSTSALIADIPLTAPQVGLSWLPPPKLEASNIIIMPTHVGYDGFIYFHLYEEDSQLKSLSGALGSIFNATNYMPTNDLIREGQICIAQFYLDKQWHRAEILKIMKEDVEVRYVDYGNKEMIKFDEIRTHVAFLEFPLLCHKAQLYNVKPVSVNGQWPESTLNFISDHIVDKICDARVEKCSDLENEMYISVNLPGNVPLENLLEEKKLIDTCTSPIRITFEQLIGEVRKVPYAKMSTPEVDSIMPVVITQLCKTNLICMQRMKVDKPTTLAEQQMNEDYKHFLLLMQDLADNASKFPLLENPKPGMSCCGQYTYDDNWYRCLVMDRPNDDMATVFYVDYGNTEDLPVERLRKLPKYYLKCPAQGLICQLHGLKPVDDVWSEKSYTAMADLLFDKSSSSATFQAKIMSTGPPLEVILLTTELENEEDSKVAYESLIKNGTVAY